MLANRPAVRALLAAAALIPFADSAAHAQPAYTFTNIIDSTMDPSISGDEGFAIDGGTVAYGTGQEIFTVAGGDRTLIARVGDTASADTIESFAILNEVGLSDGNVAFSTRLVGGGAAIFRGAGGPLTKIAKMDDMTAEGPVFLVTIAPSISGETVVFGATISSPGPNVHGIYAGNGSSLTTIVKTGDPTPMGTITGAFVFGASISGDRVAFGADTTSPLGEGVYVSAGGALTTIARSGSLAPTGIFSSFGVPRISGEVTAFGAHTTGGGHAIYASADGVLTTIVKQGDPAPSGTLQNLIMGGVDDGGRVAFSARWDVHGQGAFFGDGDSIVPVIKRGEELFGQTLAGLGHDYIALDPNGSGRVAFAYWLANGVRGIAMATPVPEPAAGSMLAIAALAAVSVDRRRHARGDTPT
jgi:hypothetical protein